MTPWHYRVLLIITFSLALNIFLGWLRPVEEKALDEALIEGRWQVEEANGVVMPTSAASASLVWVDLQNGRFAGSDGCADLGANYEVAGAEIVLMDVELDPEPCAETSAEPEVATVSDVLREMMAQGVIHGFAEDDLMAWVADGQEVVFARRID